MKLSEIISKLNLEKLNNKPINDKITITNGYIGDLLSQVMAGAKPGSLWITIQSHLNIIGVAVMTNIPAIIICEGHNVPDNVIEKADEEKIAIFNSQDNAFQLAGKLFECGIK
jgi:serine kinase of HPr protein (carbohydrate metabolism regulator)